MKFSLREILKIYTTIKKNLEFKKIYYNAPYKIGFLTVIYYKKNKDKSLNLGITVSKKVGNAVKRNRVRRIILAAYKEFDKTENLEGFSLIIVARKNSVDKKMWDILKELKKNLNFLKNF